MYTDCVLAVAIQAPLLCYRGRSDDCNEGLKPDGSEQPHMHLPLPLSFLPCLPPQGHLVSDGPVHGCFLGTIFLDLVDIGY